MTNLDTEQTSNGIYPDPELERDVYEPSPPMMMRGQDPDIMEVLRLMQGNPQEPMGNPQAAAAAQLPETPTSRFIRSPLPIIFLALFTYIAFALNVEEMFGGNVFSFFIVWELLVFTMTAFILKDSSTNQLSSIIALLPLVLPRLNTQALQMSLKVFTFANKMLRDFAVFLFTFIAMHLTYSYVILGESVNRILDSDFNRIFAKDF